MIILFAIVGLVVGSFLNVCIDRLPQNKSIAYPPSHCEACQHKLGVKDLIPVFSYLRLRGRCRYCQASIPRKLLWVELATAVIFGLLYWHYRLSPEFGVMAFYACLFIIIFVIDLEHSLILNRVVYPGIVIAFLLSLYAWPWFSESLGIRVAYAALGGAVGFGIFLLIAVVSRGGMGWGDVKLAAFIGLATGFPMVFFAIIMAAILGGIVAVVLLATKKKGRRQMIPFGPFLVVAAMVTLLWGSHILSWYLGLM